AARGGRRRPRDLRPWPGARAGVLHRRGVRRLRPRARRADRRRRALRRARRPLRPLAAGGRLRPGRRPPAPRRRRGGAGDAVNAFGLTIAVPRGALFAETLDALDAIGGDTAEVRANDRKLLFRDAGIVTMRPSD